MKTQKSIQFLLITLLCLSVFLNYKYESRTLLLSNRIHSCFTHSIDTTMSKKADTGTDNVSLMRRGWTNSIKKLHINSDIAFFGDSHTYFADFQKNFPDISICNLGLEGDNMKHFPKRLDMLRSVNPDKIFFMGGVNSIKENTTVLEQQYRELFDLFRDSLPHTKIYIQSILPVNPIKYDTYSDNTKIKSVNLLLEKLAKDYSFTYIDLYSVYESDGCLPMTMTNDGIHIKPECYDLWAEAITDYVYN